MVDNLAKYVYEIYLSKSVSAAAKKLFISQPALSASLKKAEELLGAQIFNRKTVPFTLTAEGKIYIEAIQKAMELQQQTMDKIRDIQEIKSGKLNIATSANIAHYVIPKICEIFTKKYPNIEIFILISNTNNIKRMLLNNEADLAFLPNDTGTPGLTTIRLLKENLVVAIKRNFEGCEGLMPYALTYNDIVNRTIPEDKYISDMNVFHGLGFIYSPPDSYIYKKKKLIFGNSGPYSFINTNTIDQKLNYNLMQSGFGALLTTDADITTMPENDNCVYFALKNPEANQYFSVAHAKRTDSPSYRLVHEYIKTTKEFFDCDNPLKKIL